MVSGVGFVADPLSCTTAVDTASDVGIVADELSCTTGVADAQPTIAIMQRNTIKTTLAFFFISSPNVKYPPSIDERLEQEVKMV
jgi:hypothetical protein